MANRLIRFPRADAGQPYVLDGDLYNDIVNLLEWLAGIGVQYPLMMQDNNGPKLSVQRGVGQAVIQLHAVRASWPSTGAARYDGCIGTGPITAVDPDSNFQPPDADMTFPATPNCIAVDVYEGGAGASGTCVLNTGSSGAVVLGTFIGTDNKTSPQKPVFYFSSAPSATAFKVLTNQVGGTQGDATTKASWTYDIFLWDGSGLQLGAALPSLAQRPIGQLNMATEGWAYIDSAGVIQLGEAIEPPITAPCTPAAPDVAARAFAYFVAG